jgi:hypothetical protein
MYDGYCLWQLLTFFRLTVHQDNGWEGWETSGKAFGNHLAGTGRAMAGREADGQNRVIVWQMTFSAARSRCSIFLSWQKRWTNEA